MGLTKKKTPTNLIILRSELNNLNVNSEALENKEPIEGSGCKKQSGSGIVKEAVKKRGRKKAELIDGAKLMCF